MTVEQPGGGMSSEQMLAEQLALLKRLEAAEKSALRQQEGAAASQNEMIATLYRFMRVTVDIQEVMLRRLNVIGFSMVALVILTLIGVFALFTR
jgi:hypothetical protein